MNGHVHKIHLVQLAYMILVDHCCLFISILFRSIFFCSGYVCLCVLQNQKYHFSFPDFLKSQICYNSNRRNAIAILYNIMNEIFGRATSANASEFIGFAISASFRSDYLVMGSGSKRVGFLPPGFGFSSGNFCSKNPF